MKAVVLFSLKWLCIAGFAGSVTGSASALFLAGLDLATRTREANAWLLWLLPVGGAAVAYLYMKAGKEAGRGNNLIIEQIHDGNGAIPLRMAPLVLIGTWTTHLFGGSAGREGTAVQMGGSLAERLGRLLKLNATDRKLLLICGISGGFGSVFGTPLAGTVFGLEVLAIGMIGSYEALLPCFVASSVGHLVTTAWGIRHIHYAMGPVPAADLPFLAKLIAASIAFGLAALLFTRLTKQIKLLFGRWFKHPVLRSAAGGLIVIGLAYAVGTRDYLGLGLPLIRESFETAASPLDFLLKTLFTSVTLGAGFQGGEVTPLFVIGSTLGSALAGLLGVSAPFLAAVGFVSVFGGAAKTPIACFVMGIELFGSEGAVYLFIGCLISFLFSGRTGIYEAQRQ
ncbi:voltage-gated chloride channel family protein [Paenibacillus arenilitoris]|uniref:Voltage-gated chloride channel family protein n=1 Tax=Paenibacillus arenilitoris TaxID=2772299 RepID=A0A927H6Q7_9BACL|nr:voltage-gated chloride channel family protein [Paenibacillus arenilitoris]MBD2869747.1 voltage-gated chloride channel family protein [Paenibacillus arenilitoris]